MKNGKKIYFFIGTNAEFIKLAPVIREFRKRKVEFKIITSGQSEIQYKELKNFTGQSKADIAIKVKTHKLSIFHFLIWMVKTFFVTFNSLRPEFKKANKNNCYFIVHGDTATSLLGSIIAKLFRLNLVHVESGLRSFNFLEPIPEEIDRFIISRLADIRFCQNDWAYKNVKNYKGVNINTHENTLVETYQWAAKLNQKPSIIKNSKKYYILYIRRQEHIFFQKDWIKDLIEYVVTNVDKKLDCIFVLPPLTSVFLNPEKLKELYKVLGKNLFMVSRLPYVEFMTLFKNAEFVVTDGCTIQEESYYMGLPFLALRNRTERTEGIGRNVLISKGNKKLINNFLKNYDKFRKKPLVIKERPSKIIADYLLTY